MSLAQFKRDIKHLAGSTYDHSCYTLDGEFKFSLGIRELDHGNSVGLGFKTEKGVSYIEYPKAKDFKGDKDKFSFRSDDYGVEHRYTRVTL